MSTKTFTIEQRALMSFFNTSSRTKMISGMENSLSYVEDTEVASDIKYCLESLRSMTDEEFSKLDLSNEML